LFEAIMSPNDTLENMIRGYNVSYDEIYRNRDGSIIIGNRGVLIRNARAPRFIEFNTDSVQITPMEDRSRGRYGGHRENLSSRISHRRPMLEYHESPMRAHRVSPMRSYRVSPMRSYRVSPMRSHRESPMRSHRVSPMRSRRVSPMRSHRASPMRSHRASPMRSHRASPTRSHRESPVRTYWM
jgi:hypothetical protein